MSFFDKNSACIPCKSYLFSSSSILPKFCTIFWALIAHSLGTHCPRLVHLLPTAWASVAQGLVTRCPRLVHRLTAWLLAADSTVWTCQKDAEWRTERYICEKLIALAKCSKSIFAYQSGRVFVCLLGVLMLFRLCKHRKIEVFLYVCVHCNVIFR